MDRAYILLSPEVSKLLDNEDLQEEIEEAFKREGIEAKTDLTPNPLIEGEDRDLILTILAATAVLAVAGVVATNIIKALAEHKQAKLESRERTVALDETGRAIRDNKGNPVFNEKVQESPGPSPKEGSSKIGLDAKIFDISVSTGNAAKKSA